MLSPFASNGAADNHRSEILLLEVSHLFTTVNFISQVQNAHIITSLSFNNNLSKFVTA